MGIASFQVGTAVTLDKGYLEFSEVTLTAYSAAGDTYQFTGQVAGALAAPLGQGGRAAYANAAGQSAGEDLLWQNPTNFNGTLAVQQTVTANAGAVTLRLALTAVLDAGHLDFGDFDRQHLTAGAVIRRSTYMLAGTAVAVRVTGDPDGNDGLHYLYSDHLGSASAIQKGDGSAPIITRYTPFGGYRAGSGTNTVTDRGFTGQPENMDLGLYYYQARFYVPGIGRFASADTIVPDPANPQSYNRYSYVRNRILNFTDPTGRRDIDVDNGGGGRTLPSPIPSALDRLIQVNTWMNQAVLWPLTAISAGTLQQHNAFSHMLETVPKSTAVTANGVSAGLAIVTGVFNQAEIIQRTNNSQLTRNQAWMQTGANGLSTSATAYLGAGGLSTGATTLAGTLEGATILGTPVVSAASPFVLTAVGVTSLAYTAPIAQGTANNMIEGQAFLPAFLDARTNFHNTVIGEQLSVRLDEQLEHLAGPIVRGIGDIIIWGGNGLQEVWSRVP